MEVLCTDGLDTFYGDMYLVWGRQTLSFKFFSREEIKQIASSILLLLVKNTIYTNIQDGQSDLLHIQIAKFINLEDKNYSVLCLFGWQAVMYLWRWLLLVVKKLYEVKDRWLSSRQSSMLLAYKIQELI